jgi:hypothetical protein
MWMLRVASGDREYFISTLQRADGAEIDPFDMSHSHVTWDSDIEKQQTR